MGIITKAVVKQNIKEYKAEIAGLKMARKAEVKRIREDFKKLKVGADDATRAMFDERAKEEISSGAEGYFNAMSDLISRISALEELIK